MQGRFDDGLDWRGERLGIRPGQGASLSRPGNRSARKRARHNCTVGREISRAWVISWLNLPSAAIEIVYTRYTRLWDTTTNPGNGGCIPGHPEL